MSNINKVKIVSLNNAQLKELLRESDLATSGTKAEMVTRLIDHLGNDEVESDAIGYVRKSDFEKLQTEIQSLRTMMTTVMTTMQRSCLTQTPVPHGESDNVDDSTPVQSSVVNESETAVDGGLAANDSAKENLNEHDMSNNRLTTCFNVRDIVSMLPDFETGDEHQTSDQFIEKIESLRIAYGWPDRLILHAIHEKLKGHAKTWLCSQDVFQNWQQFTSAFLTDFPCMVNAADMHLAMSQRTQARNEKYCDYYYIMLAKGRRGKLDDSSIIRHIINGLFDAGIQRTLSAMGFERCPDLLSALLRFEGTKHAFSQNYANSQRNKTVSEIKYDDGTKHKRVVTCFNCNEVGHISINCPQPQKKQRCSKCGKVHPKGKDCKVDLQVRSTKINEKSCFETTVTIGNDNFTALVDTGSECSLIKRSVGEKLNCKLKMCRTNIKGLCGGVRYANLKCRTKVTIDDAYTTITLYLIDDELLPKDVLLGQDVFSDYSLRLTVENGHVKVETQTDDFNVKAASHDQNFDIKCDVDDNEIKMEITKILSENSNVFASGLQGIGKSKLENMKIELTSDEIIAQKPYRVSEPKRKIVNEMVHDLLKNEIITPSDSVYASPVLLVKKKTEMSDYVSITGG